MTIAMMIMIRLRLRNDLPANLPAKSSAMVFWFLSYLYRQHRREKSDRWTDGYGVANVGWMEHSSRENVSKAVHRRVLEPGRREKHLEMEFRLQVLYQNVIYLILSPSSHQSFLVHTTICIRPETLLDIRLPTHWYRLEQISLQPIQTNSS